MASASLDLIRSIVVEDFDRSEEAAEELGPARTQALIAATFTLAANRKFGSGARPREITQYVAEFRERYGEQGQRIKPMVAEALIRGSLGEHSLLEGLPDDEVIPTEIALSFAITKDLALTDEQLEAFITEADGLASRWSQAGPVPQVRTGQGREHGRDA